MAERGNVQRRGTSSNFDALVGQYTTGLPLSSGGDSYLTLGMNLDGNVGSSLFLQSFPTTMLNMPFDASLDATSTVEQSPYVYIGASSPAALITTGGGGGPTVTIYYKMQGFYVAGNTYETWIGVGSPNSSPPSGHTLINIVVVSTFSHS